MPIWKFFSGPTIYIVDTEIPLSVTTEPVSTVIYLGVTETPVSLQVESSYNPIYLFAPDHPISILNESSFALHSIIATELQTALLNESENIFYGGQIIVDTEFLLQLLVQSEYPSSYACDGIATLAFGLESYCEYSQPMVIPIEHPIYGITHHLTRQAKLEFNESYPTGFLLLLDFKPAGTILTHPVWVLPSIVEDAVPLSLINESTLN